MILSHLEPKALWQHFEALNAVPRPSKKEERVIEFMLSFGHALQLDTQKDEAGNVIIKKPATKGLESRPVVCLQSHLDMVHQKNADTVFDFDAQGIEMYIDGDWVRAKGTTLGADNGIGVAAIMALLAATTIPHPPLEALFTIDEETGMTGALALKGGVLNATYLLNLDTEDDKELTIGCAGGVDVTATGNYTQVKTGIGMKAYELQLKGLTGGHSGMDIHLGRGNANKLLNRILLEASVKFGIGLSSLQGGSLRNAIPREAKALVCVPEGNAVAFENYVENQHAVLKREYASTDPNLQLRLSAAVLPEQLLSADFQYKLLRSIYSCPNGIYRMSPDIQHLVQSSNNLARVAVQNGELNIQCLTRSSVDSEKTDLATAIACAFELCGAEVKFSGSYPGWSPQPASTLVEHTNATYKRLFNAEAHVNAVHAGLECGILGRNYPNMQMISFGPNIRGAHSPDECVQISSVQKFWKYLLEVLATIN